MSTLLHVTTCASIAPINSGLRATERGYVSFEVPYKLEGTWRGFVGRQGDVLYTAVFFENGTHMTYHFAPGRATYPEGVEEGCAAVVTVVGEYRDEEVACLVVTFNGLTHQV